MGGEQATGVSASQTAAPGGWPIPLAQRRAGRPQRCQHPDRV